MGQAEIKGRGGGGDGGEPPKATRSGGGRGESSGRSEGGEGGGCDAQVGGAAAAATTRGARGISESRNTAVFLLLKCKLHFLQFTFSHGSNVLPEG